MTFSDYEMVAKVFGGEGERPFTKKSPAFAARDFRRGINLP